MRDEPLERAFERRDSGAYEAAYDRYGARMYTTAVRLLRDPETARECVQDVFLDLWRRGDAYAVARGSLEAFLASCARNRALMRIRSAARGQASLAQLESPQEYALEDDPIERERIKGALALLTDGQAEVVQLAYFRGSTLSEVAADLGIPIGTVKTRLSAALRSLRRSLVPENSDGR